MKIPPCISHRNTQPSIFLSGLVLVQSMTSVLTLARSNNQGDSTNSFVNLRHSDKMFIKKKGIV